MNKGWTRSSVHTATGEAIQASDGRSQRMESRTGEAVTVTQGKDHDILSAHTNRRSGKRRREEESQRGAGRRGTLREGCLQKGGIASHVDKHSLLGSQLRRAAEVGEAKSGCCENGRNGGKQQSLQGTSTGKSAATREN